MVTEPESAAVPFSEPDEPEPKYVPIDKHRRRGVALCLSGGGYRAALFHLGALERLNELGALSRVTTFSSVSGGSILAALIAERVRPWPEPGKAFPDFEGQVVKPFLKFTKRNIRTGPVLRRVLLPTGWRDRATAVRQLIGKYRKYLTAQLLAQLPEQPRFIMSATDMVFGVNFVFDSGRRRVGDYQIGYAEFPDWPVARAVAASSCFPPVFNPLPLELDPGALTGGEFHEPDRDELVEDVHLSDGGVYDNMGLEPVWKDHAHVLVSDGGAVFQFVPDTGLVSRVLRYAAIAGHQGSAVRKRWLIANYTSGEMDGTYWGIGSSPASYDPGRPGFSKAMATEVMATIRTDLDRFSDAEAEALRTHGYFLADAALDEHAPELISIPEAVTRPAPTPADEQEWRRKLAKSAVRKKLGRGYRPFR